MADYAAALQDAITDCLGDRVTKALAIAKQNPAFAKDPVLVVAGGVAANKKIAETLDKVASNAQARLIVPPAALCTDNAAMIAWAGTEYASRGQPSSRDFAPRPRWPLDESAAPPPGRGVRP